MGLKWRCPLEDLPRFCELCFGHRSIEVYEEMWSLVTFHHFAWDDLWEMTPWEYDAIVSLMAGYIETQEMRAKQQRMSQGG